MGDLLEEIENYWSNRAEGYSEQNRNELADMHRQAWYDLIKEHLPEGDKETIRILDVGTGPGFFPILLASQGYRVDGVDYTPEMLEQARENAGELNERITFSRMDAKDLDFEDDTFDVIVTRNLTWVLEEPDEAYAEWHRVLKKGGCLMNFDANWYRYLYDDSRKAAHEADRVNVEKSHVHDHDAAKGVNIEKMIKIALEVPLSRVDRPVWDAEVLKGIGFSKVITDETISNRVWDEEEKINYGSTPMFMVVAWK